MFDWLFGKKAPPEPPSVDRVWVDTPALDAALVRAAAAGPVVIYAFFEATLARVRASFAAAGREPGPDLAFAKVGRAAFASTGTPVLVAERHPLPATNRAFLEQAQSDHPGVVPIFFVALDDPMMRRFGGDRTATVMRQLGLSADEPVEHPLVTRALAQAREKIAAKVGPSAELDAAERSVEAWLDRHLGPAPAG